MKITGKKVYHKSIGTEWEFVETVWDIKSEESDFNDPRMFSKFEFAEITQKKYLTDKVEYTWFKGYGQKTGTRSFSIFTEDKLKQEAISIFVKFLLDNHTPIGIPFFQPKPPIE
jgi:hypothetical protein